LNFAGPFDAKSLSDSPVSLDGEGFAFGAKPGFVQHHPSDSHIVVPDAHLLFSGNYVRIGSDLIISSADQKFVVGNYFKGETRPALISNDGATLSGQIVDALTGHVHYAQAAGVAPAAVQVIGHVLKMSGSATAIRNGVSIELHIGDAVQKGDVVQTGSDSSIGMTFVDGSAFGMTSNARMVLNEMIYDPNGSSNSSLISLVQGTITFVAGQTAKNGNMRVETPVATMGIRGTAVLVEIAADNGPTRFSVLVEPDGHTGSYNLYDKATGQLIGTVSQAGQVTFVSVGGIGQPPTAIEQLKTLQDQQQEKALIQQVFQLYFPNYNPDNSNPKSQKFGSSSYNNLAEITFTTTTNQQHTFLTQIELRFAVTDPLTGVTTYQNRIFYNTKAQFSAIPVFGDQAFVWTTETFKFMDVVRIDDPDIGNGPFYDIGVPFVAGSAVILSAISTTSAPSEAALKDFLTINQTTGEVMFNRQDFNFLDDGETVKYVIRVTATSGPDTGYVEIPVTITGANDVPVFGTPVAVELHEIGIVPPDTVPPTNGDGVLQETITLHFTDADFSETGSNYAVDVSAVSTTGSTAGFAPATLEASLRDFFSFATTPVTKDVNHTDGYIHGTFHADDKAFDYLAEGQQLVITYTVELTEQDYGSAHFYQSFTVTITGSNDVPVIALADLGQIATLTETVGETGDTTPDVPDPASGVIHFSDADLTDSPTASIALQSATYVSVSGATLALTTDQFNAIKNAFAITQAGNTNNGGITWSYSIPDNELDFLAKGEKVVLTSTVEIDDHHGGTTSTTVTINIFAGTNDKPVITSEDLAGAVTEPVTPSGDLTDAGVITFTDTDLTDVHLVSPAGTPIGPTLGSLAVVQDQDTTGTGLNGQLTWTYTVAASAVEYLAKHETRVEKFTITLNDQNGGLITKEIDVTVTGTNDDAIISVAAGDHDAGVVTEDAHTTGSETTSGTLSFSDVDLIDTHIVNAMPVGTTLGTLTALKIADTSSGTGGSLEWTYEVANSAIQYLAAGEHKDETFTVSVFDGTSTVTRDIVVTITGTNDAPVITADSSGTDGTNVHDLTEGDSGVSTSGTLAVVDADVTNTVAASVFGVAVGGVGAASLPLSLDNAALKAMFSVDAGDVIDNASAAGTIHWSFNSGGQAFDFLADGETLVLTYTVRATDSDSAHATGDQTVVVQITGTNDAPIVVADTPVHLVEATSADAGTSSAVATLTLSDVDGTAGYDADALGIGGWSENPDHTYSKAGTYGTATLDTLTNKLTYVLDNHLADGLTASDHPPELFTVPVKDDFGATASVDVTFTVDGTNDAPALNGDNVSVTEIGDGSPALPYGTTKIFDIALSDSDEMGSLTVSATAGDGTVSGISGGTIAAINGNFAAGITYTPNNTVPNANDVVTLTVSDSHGLSDTLHFVFQQNGTGGAALTGTTGKDLIFSTGGDDTMTGQTGADNFVFAAQSGNDIITDFHSGDDHIVLNDYGDPFSGTTFDDWLASQVNDTVDGAVIDLGAGNSITLTNVVKASLTVNDFIIHPGGTGV
jgi:VCBS repeat-containing protein